MGYRAPFPTELGGVEYVKLYFHLELTSYLYLPAFGLLQLRRELLRGLKTVSVQCGDVSARQLKELLQPDLPTDPVQLRQIQKPSPALVICPDLSPHGAFAPQQKIILPIFFIGSGIHAINSFVCLLQYLGSRGLYHETGQFTLKSVEAEDGSGFPSTLWSADKSLDSLTPPVNNLSWWLERQPFLTNSLQLEVITPLRLLRRGKPLFKVNFVDMFPYLLRRVTALLTGYAEFELVPDPARFISLSRSVKVLENQLYWKDWRTLNREQGGQSLGGLMGQLNLAGDELVELLWVLQLGSLFNIGKGAAYGAGQYRLNYS